MTEIEQDAATFAAVKERFLRGVPAGREVMAGEVAAVIRHAMRLEFACAAQDEELRRRGYDAMEASADPMRAD